MTHQGAGTKQDKTYGCTYRKGYAQIYIKEILFACIMAVFMVIQMGFHVTVLL